MAATGVCMLGYIAQLCIFVQLSDCSPGRLQVYSSRAASELAVHD